MLDDGLEMAAMAGRLHGGGGDGSDGGDGGDGGGAFAARRRGA
ncbi:hypothetical protein [Burkholderia thailandensis]|nr:hypothetical protein [Burkholderia thailandensis]MCS6424057.1 hypothetical protein [Burkholderia thailandensis]MCS6463614.1 hypothetical protein [Burkholderia thailandensis]